MLLFTNVFFSFTKPKLSLSQLIQNWVLEPITTYSKLGIISHIELDKTGGRESTLSFGLQGLLVFDF